MSLRKIVVATDGSTNAARALDAAIDLAKHYDANLIIVHAVISGELPSGLIEWARAEHLVDEQTGNPSPPMTLEDGRLGTPTPDYGVRVSYEAREGVARAVADHAKSHAETAGVKSVQTIVDDGDPARVIRDAITQESADLAVIGTRGHGTLKGLLVGSVSHKLVGMRLCPTLVVP